MGDLPENFKKFESVKKKSKHKTFVCVFYVNKIKKSYVNKKNYLITLKKIEPCKSVHSSYLQTLKFNGDIILKYWIDP